MIFAICALIFLLGGLAGLVIGRSRTGPGKQPLPAPDPDSACKCSHEKSYHEGGKGKCIAIDIRLKYSSQPGSPPCRCQIYVPSKPVPAAALLPAGRYDPAYTAFLEWWTQHWNESEGKPL